MAQLTGPNLYRVTYKVITPGVNTDPPAVVGPHITIAVLAADIPSACAVAKTAAGLTGQQTIYFRECQQQPNYTQIWQ